jgi:tetratricopeptide (TPR) repeat protein
MGVSRQTIFRWREGLTSRPRQREDVLVLARKLRLTPEEQDKLLLAAGFRPEQFEVESAAEAETLASDSPLSPEISPPQATHESARDFAERQQQASAPARGQSWAATFKSPPILAGLAVLLIVIFFVTGTYWMPPFDSGRGTPTVTPALAGQQTPPADKPTLILITPFANYASPQAGFNIAGRLAEALQQEVADLALDNVQVEIWPEPIAAREEALQVGQSKKATLVIYGEYDVGRVVVEFAYPLDQNLFADPALRQHVVSLADLSTALNTALPQQVSSLALIALGQIYLNQEQADQALPLLQQARDNLRDDSAVAEKTWALLNFYLGLAYQHAPMPDLNEAIGAYDEAVARWPEMLSSRLNRMAAYETRNQPGDLAAALTDAEAIIAAAPEWPLAYNNRASIRLTMGGPENLALALADLEQTLTLDPDLPEAYLNRAYVHFGQGATTAEIRPDVEQALALRPGYGNALNLLCWGYSLEQQAKIALPFCEQAVAAAPDEPLFRDSRGVAYALLGNYAEATADFEVYATWLAANQPEPHGERDLQRRRAWLEALAAAENPFTPEILGILRAEFRE